MLLSQVLNNILVDENVEIINEQEFSSLGLLASKTNESILTFLDDIKYVDMIPNNVTMLLTRKELATKLSGFGGGIATVNNPRAFFFHLHNALKEDKRYIRNSQKTIISPSAQISPWAFVEAENVIIGENVVIEPFAYIYANTCIGDGTIIRSGAKIGGCGFEFKRENNKIFAVEHLGGVILGEYVEIQNNTCIDRAIYPWDDTVIGNYSKIDNLVHVGHAVKIRESVMIAAGCFIGGRTEIKSGAWIGVGSTLRNGITVGESARVNMGSVASRSVNSEESVTGNFAIPHDKFMKHIKDISK